MNTFILVGPSGVGKSTAAKELKKICNISVFDLDKEMENRFNESSISTFLSRIGNKQFFDLSVDTINALVNENHCNILVVVGAGSIAYEKGLDYYRKKNLIALTGDPSAIYERGNRQKFHPEFHGYLKSEFSEYRKKLYSLAKETIDVTNLSIEQVGRELERIINS